MTLEFGTVIRTARVTICAIGFATSTASAQLAPPAPQTSTPPTAPEASSGLIAKNLVVARRHMVVAANPLAADAGNEILNAGGSAVDAMIATQLVLNLVEPQSSGLGGGAFLVTWNPTRGELKTYDGRETAPQSTVPTQFLKPDGAPLTFSEASLGGTATGVPGLVQMLDAAHRAQGKLPWAQLFTPAIKLAELGFPVSPRLQKLLESEAGGATGFDAASRAYFFDADGKPRPAGYILKNPEFAETLRAIAASGPAAFYDGPVAAAIVEAVAAAPHPSGMTLADLAAYRAKERPPVCAVYHRHRICGMGPPSSGALTIAQALMLLEPFNLGSTPMTPRALHLIAEAEKLAFADRDQYIADPDVVPPPSGLLDRTYLAQRRVLINRDAASPKAQPGEPPGRPAQRAGLDATFEAAICRSSTTPATPLR